MSDDDEELAKHMIEKQLLPQLRARDLPGIEAEFVNTAPDAEGYPVTCDRCGRTAKLPFPVPEGKIALCPDCLP